MTCLASHSSPRGQILRFCPWCHLRRPPCPFFYTSGSQLRATLPSRGHLAVSRGILGLSQLGGVGRGTGGGASGIQWARRPRMLRSIPWCTVGSPRKYPAPNVNGTVAEKPWSLPCPASQGNSNLQELPAVLCPLPGLASLPWLPQELEPLSRMPFGSGQVSPAAFPAGHAMHPPELMCSIIYSHGAPVFIQQQARWQPPCQEEIEFRRGPQPPPADSPWCVGTAVAWRHLGTGRVRWPEHVVSPSDRPIRQQQPLPEDGLLNISRNSAAKPVNCFLGNTLNKDGGPPAGRAESPAWTELLGNGRACLRARVSTSGKGSRAPWPLEPSSFWRHLKRFSVWTGSGHAFWKVRPC